MLQWEHSAIHLTFIKLPFVLSIFEWPFSQVLLYIRFSSKWVLLYRQSTDVDIDMATAVWAFTRGILHIHLYVLNTKYNLE